MRAHIEALLQRYGSSVTVQYSSHSFVMRAFLQPVTSKSWQNMERMIPSGGQVPRGQYLLIAPPDIGLYDAEYLSLHGKKYLLRRADIITYGDEVLFQWGLLVEGGRDDPWTSY